MPNHFHGIVHFFENRNTVGAYDRPDDLSVGAYDHFCTGDRPDDLSFVGAYGHTPQHSTQNSPQRETKFRSPSHNLGAMIRGFKSAVTTRINALRGTPGAPVWQRNYYDHIIRSERAYAATEAYILENPLRWAGDEENRLTA